MKIGFSKRNFKEMSNIFFVEFKIFKTKKLYAANNRIICEQLEQI